MLTQEELKSVLSYDSITGHFYWLVGVFSTFEEAVAAKKAGEKLLSYHQNHGNCKA